MENNRLPFPEKDVQRILGSPEVQQLLKLLNKDGGQALRSAANALRCGNSEVAKQILAPIMETKEAANLIDKLNQKNTR